MRTLTCTPPFLAEHPAPAEWQERVQRLDPDLWVAWNPFHQAGPSWIVVRHHGYVDSAVHIVGLETTADWSTLWRALRAGWGIVEYVLTPDGVPCDLDDRILGLVAQWLSNVRPRVDAARAEREIEKAAADAEAGRKKLTAAGFKDAFDETVADGKIAGMPNPYAPGLIFPSAKEVKAFG